MKDAVLRAEEHLQALERAEERLGAIAQALTAIDQRLDLSAQLQARRDMIAHLESPRFADPLRLEHSGFKVHSEYDEDGILGEIFKRIGATSRTFVEFGAGDGNENCTAFLLLQGWRGLWIEGDAGNIEWIGRRWPAEIEDGRLAIRDTFVTVDTIDDVIRGAGLSGEIDLLVVDIDGNDYHVLQKIESVTPRVICVEYNSNFPPSVRWIMPRKDDWVFDRIDYRTGASLKAFEELLSARGFALVGCSLAGVNAFFVRTELAAGKFAEPFTAEHHYNPWRPLFAGRPWRPVTIGPTTTTPLHWRGRHM